MCGGPLIPIIWSSGREGSIPPPTARGPQEPGQRVEQQLISPLSTESKEGKGGV